MKLTNNIIGKIDLTLAAILTFIYEVNVTQDKDKHQEYFVKSCEKLGWKIHDIWGSDQSYNTLNKLDWKSLYNRGGTFELKKVEDET